MSQYQAPPKNEMDHPRLALKGIKHAQGKTVPSLKVALLDNIARLRCYTGVEGEKSITAKLDPNQLEAIMNVLVKLVIPNKEDHKRRIQMRSLWIGGKRRDEPGDTESIILGRHNGKVFISLYGYNSSKVAFPFTYGDMFVLYDENNEPLDPKLESDIAAESWANSILRMIYPATVKNYKHPEAKNFNNNGGGGGGYNNRNNNNNGGGNGGGYQQNNSFDDDLAF